MINELSKELTFKCIDKCSNVSSEFSLIVLDSDKYFRNGKSVWYYDSSFNSPQAIIPFEKGEAYGYIRTYYPNGKLESEGECRTIRYFQQAGSKVIFRIDKKDTVKIQYQGGETYDSIKALSKYSFTSQLAYETAYNELGLDSVIIYFPFYQRQKQGPWKYYNEKGDLLKKELYSMGKPVKQ
ncbi:MAG: hypothetical protein QM737_18610 [Ferruginibacter sp.]